ncbi:ATPase [Enterovibrio norvegicus]|uniref:cell division protein ZapE n=1 Tax=Enterovibrio norvegicus TaxID=188144 RepID=UPI000C83F071|nr:cell division protein ZapE [Enterovibrio norvegicus]MCC4799552.1 cell division protein ZapE [Enterovibrio norvegicus]PMI37214.1 ATPase [Enterovibrio norvegicus]PMN50265.1 ATPase [Enterovibrio norvegicus]
MTPLDLYNKDLQRPDFFEDASQRNAVMLLDDLYHRLVKRVNTPQEKPSFLKSLFGQKSTNTTPEKGLYFWGGVGRGKTYLVDTFFDSLPFDKKMRIHFHRFMHRVHHELRMLDGQVDPLQKIADKLADETHILCFDEFFVSDITDAMILGTLMEALFERGICLVATSNIVPDELYRNGLQRARFLPAIALINAHCDVVNVDAGTDYRLRTLEQAEIYHFPLDEKANTNLESYFCQLATELMHSHHTIEINNRPLLTVREAEGVVHFDFATLCDSPRSQSDYIEVARLYHTVLLSDVPQMGASRDDAARRFIAMVDEFYERHVKLIISAEVALTTLYVDGRLNFEFKRCCSRLKEMQSHDYLALEHLP